MRKRNWVCELVVVGLVWFGGFGAQAQEPVGEAQKPWSAQWIAAPGTAQRDEVVLHFRKVIQVPALVEHFLVDVSADNQFIFYVNGKRVGNGPAKSDLAHWRYESLDLGPFLHAGKNVLGATVWNFGTHGAVSQMSDRVGFLVHGSSEKERSADTDVSWDVEEEKGIATLKPELPGFYYAAAPGERWDAGKIDWGWDAGETTGKSAWTKAMSLGRGALRFDRDAPNNWQLVADPLPAMEMKEVETQGVVRETGIDLPPFAVGPDGRLDRRQMIFGLTTMPLSVDVNAHKKVSLLIDQGQLITGYPALTVSDGAGSKIWLTYAEALYDEKGQKGDRNDIRGKHILGIFDEFMPNGEMFIEFMPLGWRTWRYLQIDVETADHPVKLQGLRTWFNAYPFEEKGYFRADDESLQKIWEIGWRTARLDAHDTYMDTPYWERLQYIGDTRIQAMVTYAVGGDDRLPRQAIDAFNNSRVTDGLTQSRYPSELVQMIPTFSLMWVGMVHDFWIYRGDAEFVKAQLPGMRTVMGWYVARQRADGLLGRIPWWPFVDWGKDFDGGDPPQEADGQSSVITLQYVEALRYAAEVEDRYGDKHLAEEYRAAATRAAEAVWKLCWNARYGLLADTPEQRHFSQHANILGVWLDVIPRERQKDVLSKILSASEKVVATDGPVFQATGPVPPMTIATYYFRYYLARAVEHAGLGDRYLNLLGPWQEMVKLGLTTWAESPEPTRSDSHAWSAHPNFDLLRIVAGIQPKEAGFSKVQIAPHLGALKRVEAGMPTARGMIEVKYVREKDGLEAEVTLPEGVTGEIVWEGKSVELQAGEQKVVLGR
jgi:alpha-L-rhamnosidase